MSRVYNFPNPRRVKLIRELRKTSKEKKVKIWEKVADELEKSRRERREINLRKLNKCTRKNDQVLVPGKVLGEGRLDHKVKVAAFKFSSQAEKRIKDAGGKTLTIKGLVQKNPDGGEVKILG